MNWRMDFHWSLLILGVMMLRFNGMLAHPVTVNGLRVTGLAHPKSFPKGRTCGLRMSEAVYQYKLPGASIGFLVD